MRIFARSQAKASLMPTKKIAQFEFIALMAAMMSLAALSIDAILPGLPQIGHSLNHAESADLQLIIIMIFLGLGFGQLVLGTLSDSYGRKPIVYLGVVIFIFASLICIFATTLEMMLVGRVLQGVGLSAPRSVSTSIIRDLYVGDYMARIMSFIAVIFILVPMIAPIMGQFVLDKYDWQAIFYFQMLFAVLLIIWFARRQVETLSKEKRIKLSRSLFIDGTKEFMKHPDSVLFTLVSGLMTGGFMVYLSSSQHIFQDLYGMQEEFVYIFAGLAFFMGLATFLNGSLVMRFGMLRLATTALIVFTATALIYMALFYSSKPSIVILLVFTAAQFLSLGFVFGNIRAITMQPIGHIAGIGASISGFVSTVLAVPIAALVGQFLTDTPLPMFIGFFSCGLAALVLVWIAARKRIPSEVA